MAFKTQDTLEMDEDLQVEEAREYLQIFNRNFQDGVVSLSDMYIESVANYLRCMAISGNRTDSGSHSSFCSDDLQKELDTLIALNRLLQSALRVSQALIKKYLQEE